VTRDFDLLVCRNDLQRIAETAESLGYHARKMMGGYTLIRPEQDHAEAVYLHFAGERSKSTQPLPHPELHPEEKQLFGISIPVAPLKDLLQMKVSSLGPKDLIHLEILDDLGLITADLEGELPPLLQERLKGARQQIAENRPDLEG
jgi:hypothetical protein